MKLLHVLLLFFLSHTPIAGSNITIVGCGYVGLTLAGVLLNQEHKITCLDIDKEKISHLQEGMLPIYEPHLHNLLFNSFHTKNISFTQDLEQTKDSEIYFICVATPTDAHGECDCSFLNTAFNNIVNNFSSTQEKKIVCIKSTVPPGTVTKLHNSIPQAKRDLIHVVYNPEFMREGTALQDMCHDNPVVLGGESLDAIEKIENLYSFLSQQTKVIKTNFETAEMIKYAWNSFSALRIAFTNELAFLCRHLSADIEQVIEGLALSEELLPTACIKPGPGYGGSCLPKDVLALSNLLGKNGFYPSIVTQTIHSNRSHKKRVIADIISSLDRTTQQPIVTLLGLSFKANTNDIRNSPAIDVIKALLEENIAIKACDPQAINDMKKLFPSVEYFESPYDAVKNSDCIVVLTEWQEFKELDFDKVASLCNKRILIDTRNVCNSAQLKKYNFHCITMGLRS